MSIQNTIEINDISQFSDLNEVCLATTGKYGKHSSNYYRMTILGDMVFIHCWNDNITKTIDIPSHYEFKYTDNDGSHIVNENVKSIDVNGTTFFSFIYKNTEKHTYK